MTITDQWTKDITSSREYNFMTFEQVDCRIDKFLQKNHLNHSFKVEKKVFFLNKFSTDHWSINNVKFNIRTTNSTNRCMNKLYE